jgi:hypothetical protein
MKTEMKKIELNEIELRVMKEALTTYIEDRKKAAWNGWPVARLEMDRGKELLSKIEEVAK